MSDSSTHPALTIHCRECGASPGQRCESRYGAARSPNRPHFYRKLDAEHGTDPGPQPTYDERLLSAVYDAQTGGEA